MSAMAGDWRYAIGSNLVFSPVLVSALLLVGLVLLMLAFSLLVDVRRHRQELRAATLRRVWIPFLFAAVTEPKAPPEEELPRLLKRDIYSFVLLWNSVYSTVRGGSLNYQRGLARHLTLFPKLNHWLGRGRIDHRLAAIVCFGNLREYAAWDELVAHLDARNTVESLTSARALIKIDAKIALPLVWQRLQRKDWSASRLTAMLSEVPADILHQSLHDYVEHLPAPALRTLMRVANEMLPGQLNDVMAKALQRYPDDDALKALICNGADSPIWLTLVRSSLDSPHKALRVAAVKALGRIGQEQDRPALVHALIDPFWWVRYRSAQSLTRLPGVTTAQLHVLANKHPSADARAILSHVIAENAL